MTIFEPFPLNQQQRAGRFWREAECTRTHNCGEALRHGADCFPFAHWLCSRCRLRCDRVHMYCWVLTNRPLVAALASRPTRHFDRQIQYTHLVWMCCSVGQGHTLGAIIGRGLRDLRTGPNPMSWHILAFPGGGRERGRGPSWLAPTSPNPKLGCSPRCAFLCG